MRLMRALMFLFITAVAIHATAAPTQHWVNEDKKTVYFVPRPKLSVTLEKIEADDEYWAQLVIDLSYSGVSYKDLDQNYQGYQFVKMNLQNVGSYELRINSLGLAQNINPLPGLDGPYYHEVKYLSKAQTRDLETLMRSSKELVSISGKLRGTVVMPKVIEEFSMGDVCTELARKSQTVHDLILNYGDLVAKVNLRDLMPTTKTSFKAAVLNQCFKVSTSKSIQTFDDLLGVEVERKANSSIPRGETVQDVRMDQVVELQVEYEGSLK